MGQLQYTRRESKMTNSKELKFKELLLRRDYIKLKKEYIRCYIGAKKYYESSNQAFEEGLIILSCTKFEIAMEYLIERATIKQKMGQKMYEYHELTGKNLPPALLWPDQEDFDEWDD